MKDTYTKPMADKLVFDFNETVTASDVSFFHGDQGHGLGYGGGCDHDPGHNNPKKPHP